MNVLAVLAALRPPSHPDPVGGGEISNRQLLASLAERGHNVTVYAFNAGSGAGQHVNGVDVVDGGLGHSGVIGRAMAVLQGKRSLHRLGKISRPDIVLAGTSTVGKAMKISRWWNVPVATLVRAERDTRMFTEGSYLRNVAKRLFYGSTSWVESDHVIANSYFLLDFCRHAGFEGEGGVVYPAVDVEIASVDWPSQVRTIGMVGSSRQKGVETFTALAKRLHETTFVLIGDRSVPPGDTHAVGNILHMGWTNDPIGAIDKCDAVLMPTVQEEAFGRAAVEAIRRKRYVIASNLGGLAEAVGDSSLLVEPGNLESWHERVSSLIDNPRAFVPAMEKALEVAKTFELSVQTDRLEKVLSYIKSGRKSLHEK